MKYIWDGENNVESVTLNFQKLNNNYKPIFIFLYGKMENNLFTNNFIKRDVSIRFHQFTTNVIKKDVYLWIGADYLSHVKILYPFLGRKFIFPKNEEKFIFDCMMSGELTDDVNKNIIKEYIKNAEKRIIS